MNSSTLKVSEDLYGEEELNQFVLFFPSHTLFAIGSAELVD